MEIQLRDNPATSAYAAKHLTSAEGRLLPSDAGTPDAGTIVAFPASLEKIQISNMGTGYVEYQEGTGVG